MELRHLSGVTVIRLTRTLALLTILSLSAAGSTYCAAGEERPDYVPGVIRYRDGRAGNWNMANSRLSIESSAGRIRLWLHEVRSITNRNSGNRCTVYSINNDEWSGEIEPTRFDVRLGPEVVGNLMDAFSRLEVLQCAMDTTEQDAVSVGLGGLCHVVEETVDVAGRDLIADLLGQQGQREC